MSLTTRTHDDPNPHPATPARFQGSAPGNPAVDPDGGKEPTDDASNADQEPVVDPDTDKDDPNGPS